MNDTMNTDFLKRSKNALNSGENFLAYDLAEKSPDIAGTPSAEKLHIMSLALARSGSLSRAKELAALLPETNDESAVDICGLKSRLFKDTAIVTPDPAEKRKLFHKAAEISEKIFNEKHAWYNGINAASCYFLSGDLNRARQLVASSVLPRCESETNKDMWLDATFGECYLLLGDYPRSADFYSKAAETAMATGRFGDFGSTLRQLRLLSNAIGDAANSVWASLHLPKIAIFSGHCIDERERPVPRFPLSAVPWIRKQIAQHIANEDIRIGFCSCAAGSDILFAQELLDAGGKCHIVPPFSIESTVRNCIAKFPGEWESMLHDILEHPQCSIVDPECDETGECEDCAYDFANRYLLGLARLRARDLNLPLVGLSVWDGKDSGLPGGTGSAIKLWNANALSITSINPRDAV